MKKKTNIEELDRGIYDIIEDVEISKKLEKGLTEEIVREISKEKDEPKWMLDIRLRALKKYNETLNPNWGPELDGLKMEDIVTYIKPDAKKEASWDNVPHLKDFGIPYAEKKYLAGVSAQFDSEEVYHNVKEMLTSQGVIYMDMSEAVRKYPELVQKYFTKAIDENLHKYTALHLAVWSRRIFCLCTKRNTFRYTNTIIL